MPPDQPGAAGGLLVAAAGLFLMTRLTPDSGFPTPILPAEILVGAGVGLLFPPSFQLAIRGVTHRDAGITSAVVNAATLLAAMSAAMLVLIRTAKEKYK